MADLSKRVVFHFAPSGSSRLDHIEIWFSTLELDELFYSLLMQDSYPEGLGIKKFMFDGVHIDDREFQLDSHGCALTMYTFTADRPREE